MRRGAAVLVSLLLSLVWGGCVRSEFIPLEIHDADLEHLRFGAAVAQVVNATGRGLEDTVLMEADLSFEPDGRPRSLTFWLAQRGTPARYVFFQYDQQYDAEGRIHRMRGHVRPIDAPPPLPMLDASRLNRTNAWSLGEVLERYWGEGSGGPKGSVEFVLIAQCDAAPEDDATGRVLVRANETRLERPDGRYALRCQRHATPFSFMVNLPGSEQSFLLEL